MRFTSLSNYHLSDWLMRQCLFTWWTDTIFVTAIWHCKSVDLNSHRLSPLYYKRTDESILLVTSHPATRRRGNVVTTSLCTSQRRRRYVSNETPNDVPVERRQDVSVVRLQDVLLVCRDDVSMGCNDVVPSVRLLDVWNKPHMKDPTTSQWYLSTTSH